MIGPKLPNSSNKKKRQECVLLELDNIAKAIERSFCYRYYVYVYLLFLISNATRGWTECYAPAA